MPSRRRSRIPKTSNGFRFRGQRFDCGSKAGFLQATVAFAMAREDLRDEFTDFLTDIAVGAQRRAMTGRAGCRRVTPSRTARFWLDLTRTLTRVGQAAPTGIDRVELAWADHLLTVNPQMRGALPPRRGGFFLLPPKGRARACRPDGATAAPGWAAPTRWSRLTGRRPRDPGTGPRRCCAVMRSTVVRPGGLRRWPGGTGARIYVNTGSQQSHRAGFWARCVGAAPRWSS